ncbi:MAG: hypothetical protein OES46_16315 [Gammaproteobacteria bacterium]|nr:hypothetical protein [Gammaproteobacteria bacterium]
MDLRIKDLKKRNVVKSNAMNRLEHDLPAVIARARQGEVDQTEALLSYVSYAACGSKRNPPDLQAVMFLTELELGLSTEMRQRFLNPRLQSLRKRAAILTPRRPRGRQRTEDKEEQEIVAALLRKQGMVNQQVSRPRLRGDLARYERIDKEVSEELDEANKKVSEELDEELHKAPCPRSIRRYYGKHRNLIGKLRAMDINLGVEVDAAGKHILTIKPFKSLAWFKKLPGKTRRL